MAVGSTFMASTNDIENIGKTFKNNYTNIIEKMKIQSYVFALIIFV